MNIDFTGRHVELDDRIRSHAEERLGKVVKHLGEPVEVHVRLENEKFRKIAEIQINHRRGALRSREESTELTEAITLAADHLERQAKRSRGRVIDRRRRAGRQNGGGREWQPAPQGVEVSASRLLAPFGRVKLGRWSSVVDRGSWAGSSAPGDAGDRLCNDASAAPVGRAHGR